MQTKNLLMEQNSKGFSLIYICINFKYQISPHGPPLQTFSMAIPPFWGVWTSANWNSFHTFLTHRANFLSLWAWEMLLICYCRIQHCFQTKIIGENVGGGTLNFPAKKQACFEICAQKIPISENSNSKRRGGGGGGGGEGGRGGGGEWL